MSTGSFPYPSVSKYMFSHRLKRFYSYLSTFNKNIFQGNLPANNYLFKGNNRNTRERCEICSKVTAKTPERCQ